MKHIMTLLYFISWYYLLEIEISMVRSKLIKTVFTFAAGTGVGFVANAKYNGQGRFRKRNDILTESTDPDSVENSKYRSNRQCPKSRRNAEFSEVPQIQTDQNEDVDASLVTTGVKVIAEESAEAIKSETIPEALPENEGLDKPVLEDIDEVLEKTRKTFATFIPEDSTEPYFKESLNLANSLDHVAIESTDIDSVRDFYCNILGFKELDRPKFKSKGYWIQLGNTTFHLIECPEEDKDLDYLKNNPKRREARGWESLPGSGDHFAFKVNDTIAASEKLRELGVPYKTVFNEAIQAVRVFFHDPVGNAIELNQENNTIKLFTLPQNSNQETNIELQSQLELQSDPLPELNTETSTGLQLESQPELQSESALESQPKPQAELEPESEQKPQPEPQPEPQSELQSEFQPESTTGSQPNLIDQEHVSSSIAPPGAAAHVIPQPLVHEVSLKCEPKAESNESKSMSNMQKIIFGSLLLAIYLI